MLNRSFVTAALVGLVASSVQAQSTNPGTSFTQVTGQQAAPQAAAPTGPKTSQFGTGGGSRGCSGTTYLVRADFLAANPDVCNLETFEESTTPGVTGHLEPLWACTSDVDISPGDIEGAMTLTSSLGGGVVTLAAGLIGQPTIVAAANVFAEFTVLEFCDEPTAVGLDIYSIGAPPDPVEVRFFDCDGGLIAIINVGANNATAVFAGAKSDSGCPGIFRVEIESLTGAGEVIDDVAFNGVCTNVLGGDNKFVNSGDNLTLAISEAADPSRGLLFITSVDGVPFVQLLPGLLSVPGVLCIGPLAVPAAPTVTVGLTAFLLDPSGTIVATNEKKVVIN